MSDTLAVYDFSVTQISFDFFTFLVLADLARREAGSDRLRLLLVPSGGGDGFNFQHVVPYDAEQKRWRLRNLVVDGAGLLPSCAGVLQASSREHARAILAAHDGPVYPADYSVDAPNESDNPGYLTIKANYGVDTKVLCASPQAQTYARQWLDARSAGRKPVALTLRESRYAEERNTSLQPWIGFAGYLNDRGYFPYILRDIDTAFEVPPPGFAGIAECPAAVFNIDLRMALYELSYLNVFAFTGPMWLASLSRAIRFIGFPVGRPADINVFYRQMGVSYGETVPNLNHLQRFIWHEPELAIMIEAFEAMAERLAAHEAAGCPEADLDLDPALRRPVHTIAQHFFDVNGWRRLNALVLEAQSRGDISPELDGIKRRADAEVRNFAIDEMTYLQAAKMRSQGDHESAIGLLRKLIDRRPKHVNGRIDLGLSLEALERYHEAATLYRTAVAEGFATVKVVHRLGCVAQRLGNLDDAQACFEIIVAKAGAADTHLAEDARARLAKLVAG